MSMSRFVGGSGRRLWHSSCVRAAAVLVLFAACGGDEPPASRTRVYVGTYTSQIQAFSMDPATLALTPAGAAGPRVFPALLPLAAQTGRVGASAGGAADRRRLFVVADS